MPSKIIDEAIQAITGQLFQGIDSSEHGMIPARMQQKVANELKNVLSNAGISGDTSLRDVALPLANNEIGCSRNERSEVTSSVLAPAGDNNAGEAQDDTAAPLTGDWYFDQFNQPLTLPKAATCGAQSARDGSRILLSIRGSILSVTPFFAPNRLWAAYQECSAWSNFRTRPLSGAISSVIMVATLALLTGGEFE